MMKVKISDKGKAKLKRIETLPEMGTNIIFGAVKKEIDKFIKTYQEGLKKDDFGLIPLQPKSIQAKARQGFTRPFSPLYGKGDTDKNSLYNIFRVKKLKNGYKIYMRTAKHWKANLTLKQLFLIHNYGCKIKRGDTIIQIPPRPIFLLTYERLMNKIKGDKRIGQNVKRAIVEYINNANYLYADEYINRLEKRENQ